MKCVNFEEVEYGWSTPVHFHAYLEYLLHISPRRGEMWRRYSRYPPLSLTRSTRPPTSSSFPRSSSSFVVILPPQSFRTPSLPSWPSARVAKATAAASAAACFWPFSPEWRKRPKTIKATSLPSEGECFQGGVFALIFFIIFFKKNKKFIF